MGGTVLLGEAGRPCTSSSTSMGRSPGSEEVDLVPPWPPLSLGSMNLTEHV